MGKSIDKKEVLKIIVNAAKLYKNNLCYNDFLFVYKTNSDYDYIETTFKPENYLHLTGLIYNGKGHNPIDFLNKCYKNRISLTDFEVKNKPYYYYKFDVLDSLMNIYKNARMIGDYNNNRVNLSANKVTGGVAAFMGFSIVKNNRYYPVTVIKDDIRQNVNSYNVIVAIMKKNYKEDYYKSITYCSKKYNITDIVSVINLKKELVQLSNE